MAKTIRIKRMNTSAVTVTGLGTPVFQILHFTAISFTFVSATFSFGTLVYLIRTSNGKAFWSWPISSRLVLYLSVNDAIQYVFHGSDHVVYVILQNFPPEALCILYGFILHEFGIAQNLLVLMTAVGTFVTVVRETVFHFGKYDWLVFICAYAMPAVVGVVFLCLDWFGPTGAW